MSRDSRLCPASNGNAGTRESIFGRSARMISKGKTFGGPVRSWLLASREGPAPARVEGSGDTRTPIISRMYVFHPYMY